MIQLFRSFSFTVVFTAKRDNWNMSAISALFNEISTPTDQIVSKITIVGVGQVGMAATFSMLVQHVASELCMVDVVEDKLKGELMDLQHGLAFLRHCKIKAGTDYSITAGSKICVITAGVRQREGESRLNLLQRNAEVLKEIIPKLVKYSPGCILLVVSNPGSGRLSGYLLPYHNRDVFTKMEWKNMSGLPKERVIGSGTNLDSARFRFLISEKLNIAPSSCHGWIIGEHGDSSVAVWSGVNVAGVTLESLNPHVVGEISHATEWQAIHRQVVDSAYEIIQLKGYTSWAIGLSVAAICNAILHNTRNIFAVSVNVKGIHGIAEDVYLSLPSVVCESGVSHIVKQKLSEAEIEQLHKSATTLYDVQKNLKLY